METLPRVFILSGKVTSYSLLSSHSPSAFFADLGSSSATTVAGFTATKSAGEKESYRITATEFDRNVYYALVAVDADGNMGDVSNVRQAYMPSSTSSSSSTFQNKEYANSPEHRVITANKPPQKVLLYIIVGIVAFIVLCIILVLVIVISYRRKKLSSSQTDLSDTMRSMGVSTAAGTAAANCVNGGNGEVVHSPGFAVCDEQDIIKEQETNGFLNSYSTDASHPQPPPPLQSSVVSFADDTNPYATNTLNSSTYGWTEYNNPYVNSPQNGSTLPAYRDYQGQQQQQPSGYVPNYYNHAMYARPIPKNQRNLMNNNNSTANSSSNNTANLIQHSTPQSPSGSSSNQSSGLYRHNLLHSLHQAQHQARSNSNHSSSGDERVPSISPPLTSDGGMVNPGEQVRLISSASNTPTKSILKKPKTAIANGEAPLSRQEDQSSQSSSNGGMDGVTAFRGKV